MLRVLKAAEEELQRLRDVLLPEFDGKIGEPSKAVLAKITRVIKNANANPK